MLDAVLIRKNVTAKAGITVKFLVSLGVIAMAVVLPQLVHLALGAPGGVQWLPMYLPVLIGGCLLGKAWGMGVGVLSPIVSFLITSAMGAAMPAAVRLPYMVAELAVFALVSGAFSKLIVKNAWFAFPAVLAAQAAGRGLFLALTAAWQNAGGLALPMVWAQVKTGAVGLLVQAVLVPLMVIMLRRLMLGARHD